MGKNDFIARLIYGIYNALIFTAESEKEKSARSRSVANRSRQPSSNQKIAKEWGEQGSKVKY